MLDHRELSDILPRPTQRRALMIADSRIAENAGSTASTSVVFQARECAVPYQNKWKVLTVSELVLNTFLHGEL